MKRIVVAVIAVLAVAAAAGVAYDYFAGEWEARVESALDLAEEQRVRADSAVAVADSAEARADSLAQRADDMGRRVRTRVVEVRREAVPDTCAPFVGPRDEIIDTLTAEADTWRAAYEEQQKAAASLRVSSKALTLANDSLVAVLEDRPMPRPRWVPEVGVGVFAGVCSGGETCIGAGVTLSWRVP